MSPALIRPRNLKPGQTSTSLFALEAKTMHIQSSLYPRSTDSGGIDGNTIIFIVVGVVCLLVILFGCYFVSRPHAASNVSRGVPSLHPPHPPITSPCPRRKRDMSKYWKTWQTWRHASTTEPPTVAVVPTSQVSPSPVPPSPTIPARAMTYPLIIPRPSQPRRVTSLSVTTSFSHSHITQEDLNNFRLSAYDLDGDLETEMLNSARDDVWSGHALVVVGGCGDAGVNEATDAQGNAAHTVDGGVQGYANPRRTTSWKGSDYGNSGTCQNMAPGHNGVEGNVVETIEAS